MTTSVCSVYDNMYSIVDKQYFSDWLRDILKEKDLSQAELARRAGLTRQAISNYINDYRKVPDNESLISIADALHLPVQVVFRAAGLLPNEPEAAPTLEEINHKISLLPEEAQQEVLDFIDMKLRRIERDNEQKNFKGRVAASE